MWTSTVIEFTNFSTCAQQATFQPFSILYSHHFTFSSYFLWCLPTALIPYITKQLFAIKGVPRFTEVTASENSTSQGFYRANGNTFLFPLVLRSSLISPFRIAGCPLLTNYNILLSSCCTNLQKLKGTILSHY